MSVDDIAGIDGNDDITVVHLVRHGEVHNPDGVLYGRRGGYHLSELGRQMADRVAEHLADRDITHVVASPLERAQETAQPVAKSHGLDLATDGRLIEAGNVFEGKTFGVGDGALRKPATGSTSPTRSSRPGRAVRRAGRTDDGRPGRGEGRGARPRGGLCQPPAADLDRAELRGEAAAVARPAAPAVHAGLADLVHVPGRQDRLGRLQRAGA